jgi:hypothetical protein
LFRTAKNKKRELTNRGLTGNDILRIVKRRPQGAGLHQPMIGTCMRWFEDGLPDSRDWPATAGSTHQNREDWQSRKTRF